MTINQDWFGYVQTCLSGSWVDKNEQPVLRRQIRRSEVEKFFAELAPTRIGIEARGASHHWRGFCAAWA
jgi:hypothetical protein